MWFRTHFILNTSTCHTTITKKAYICFRLRVPIHRHFSHSLAVRKYTRYRHQLKTETGNLYQFEYCYRNSRTFLAIEPIWNVRSVTNSSIIHVFGWKVLSKSLPKLHLPKTKEIFTEWKIVQVVVVFQIHKFSKWNPFNVNSHRIHTKVQIGFRRYSLHGPYHSSKKAITKCCN